MLQTNSKMLIAKKRYDRYCRGKIVGAVAEEAATEVTETVKGPTTTTVDEPTNAGTRYAGNDGSSKRRGCRENDTSNYRQ